MAHRSDNSSRLSELRMKHGRPPASPSEPKADKPETLREAQPRFRGLESGHRACQGCGEAMAARLVMESAGPDVMVANATGCLEVFTTPWPQSAWRVPWIHSLFENSAAVASGMEAAMKAKGKNTKVLSFGGDGGTYDIGFQALSGMLERHHNVLYVTYDNEAYMNTGVQRSSSTPYGTRTTTTPGSGWKKSRKKNIMEIMAAHRIPYAASASIAFPDDMMRKFTKAKHLKGGTRFLHVFATCPTGWGIPSEMSIKIARMAVQCNIFPLYEVENGLKYDLNYQGDRRVHDYLKMQGRFRHLSEKDIQDIQTMVDEDWALLMQKM